MLWRGARHRCPWCNGRGAFFSGWFRKHDTCQTCGISWQRGYEGFELGAVTVNTIIVFGVLIVGLVVGVVATTPDIPVFGLVGGLGVAAVSFMSGLPIEVPVIGFVSGCFAGGAFMSSPIVAGSQPLPPIGIMISRSASRSPR